MIKRVALYFLQGALFTVPLFITLYVIVKLIITVGGIMEYMNLHVHPVIDPLLGIVIVVTGLILIGAIGSTFIFRPVFNFLEKLIEKAPLIKTIYTSVKDLLSAFVGQKKRFNKPVLVKVSTYPLVEKFGFVTVEDLHDLGIPGKVAVYIPYSYAITGNLIVVEKESITPIKTNSAELMKFVVSGGVSDID